jgi:hypothetical protein
VQTAPHSTDYPAAARQVRHRLARVRLATGIGRSHLIAGALALATVAILRLAGEWRSGEGLVVLTILFLWLVAVAAYAVIGLPQVKSALLLLDRRGNWKDTFSSAWEFLQSPSPTAAQSLHLERAGARLPDALRGLPAVFPLPSLRWVWVAPLAALLFAITPWLRTIPDSRDLELTAGMKDAAALQAEELQREAARIKDLASLTEEEKKQLEALGVNVDAIAEKLANPEGLTTGEMLESLEGQAREAEKLAEALGLFSDGWASVEMIEAMSQQPDTADLSLFIRDKAPEPAADEALRLRALLDDPDITGEAQERVTRSLESIMQAATDDDRTKPVGERFGNASIKMSDAQTKTAAREFEELSKFFREIAGREEAVEKLDRLAEALREAGSEISGSELEKMESIADAAGTGSPTPEGLQSLDTDAPGTNPQGMAAPGFTPEAGEGAPAVPLASNPPGEAGEVQKVPVPGAAPGEGEGAQGGKAPGGEKGEQAFTAPVPGESSQEGKSGSALGMSDKSQKGEGEGGMLSAPVPGMESGQTAPGAGMTLGSGASSQSGKGGDQAGTGTAEMTEEAAAEALKATGDAQVAARAGAEGESTMKSIEGEARAEEAARSRQEVIADFIAVEEQALDDQALPLSRRQHVLRYFSAIRRQFEKDSGE